MGSSGSSRSSGGGVATTAEQANKLFPNATNVGLRGFQIGQIVRPDGSTNQGLIITGKDGTTMGFSLAVARSKFTHTTRTVTVVSRDGKKKINITPRQAQKIDRLLTGAGA